MMIMRMCGYRKAAMSISHCNGEGFRKAFMAGASWLNENKEILNQLNVFPVPDGDTGLNMSLTLLSATDKLESMTDASLKEILETVARETLMNARGCSGVIFSQVIAGFTELSYINDKFTCFDIARGLKLGTEKAYKAVTKPTEGTILTVVKESSDEAIKFARNNNNILKMLEVVLKRAKESLDKTPEMLPILAQAGVVDSGAQGFVYMLEGILAFVKGDNLKTSYNLDPDLTHNKVPQNLEYRYCTEFLLTDSEEDIPFIRKKMTAFGDDLIVIGSRNMIRIHIHTNKPEKVLAMAHLHGKPIQIKIDDMQKQHRHIINKAKEEFNTDRNISIIATAPGGGIKAIMISLGTNTVLVGDKIRNPSVSELIDAIENASNNNIILFPNDKNIIPAVNQASEITDKNVKIIPTENISQGITALLAFKLNSDTDENLKNMNEAKGYVKHGEITQANRDAQYGEVVVQKNDIIGLYDGSVRVSEKNYSDAFLQLIKYMIQDDEDEVITIYYGENINSAEAKDIADAVASEFLEQDIELHYGGQFYCSYIISLE
ncbi:DAK2 domain-containing protein [Candidatus Poribacteria bacterium]|nr:DAK2 domain-containing protein [Candidatus Poribacteria bacterium]